MGPSTANSLRYTPLRPYGLHAATLDNERHDFGPLFPPWTDRRIKKGDRCGVLLFLRHVGTVERGGRSVGKAF